jgi:hypothetical protein
MTNTFKPTVVEHNIETGEIIKREMTTAEYEKHLADKAITDTNRLTQRA